MGWVSQGFWKAWRQLRESAAIRTVGLGVWEASCNTLSRAVALAVKMVEMGRVDG
jgi:hypothetical protein